MKRITIVLSVFVWVFSAIGQSYQMNPQDFEKMNRERELQFESRTTKENLLHGRAPLSRMHSQKVITPLVLKNGTTGYAWNIYANESGIAEGPVLINLTDGSLANIQDVPGDDFWMTSGDFAEDQWITATYNENNNSELYTVDTETGNYTLIGATGIAITGLAYDAVTGIMYASSYDGTQSHLYTVSLSDGASTAIGQVGTDILVIGIAADAEGNLYGIDIVNDELLSISPADGTSTVIGALGIDISYAQDIAFDRDNDILYGTLFSDDDGGQLFTINTETGSTSLLGTFVAELAGFGIPYSLSEDAAPSAVADINVAVGTEGALEATVSWTNPSLTFDGSTLTDLTLITIERNGSVVTTIDNPVIGAEESFVDNTITEAGLYTYKVYATNSVGEGPSTNFTAYIGEDVPSAPANVTLTANGNNGALTWDAPTEGLNGGYMSGTDLTYSVVRLPDMVLVAENITENTFEDTTVPEIGNYQYAVTASNLIGEGGTAYSNAVLLGADGYLLYEGFEENWPPLGWANSGWELSSFGAPNNGDEFAYSNLAGSTLNTPEIAIPAEGVFELSFFFRVDSESYPQNFNVNISVDGGAFENVLSYTGLISAVYQEIKLGLDNYAGQSIVIQFEGLSGAGGWDWGILVDDVSIYEVYENDLAVISVTGNTAPSEGLETTYTITVGNFGYASQDTYTVKLMKEGDIELGSAAGTALAFEETATFDIAWTPTITDIGSTYVYAVVELATDEATGNNQSANLNVTVQSSDIVVSTIGTGTNYPAERMPFDFYYKNSISQSLYFADEIGVGGGVLKTISYTNNFETDLPGKDVQIWIGETELESLADGWVDPASLTLIYDGPLDFPIGENSIFIELDEPYIYGGGILVVYSYRVWEDDYFSSSDRFYGTEDAGSDRTRRAAADSDVYNPTTPPEGETSDWHPNTTFFFTTAGLGALEGTVTDGVDPVEGVMVKVLGTSSATTSAADGTYEFPYLVPATYNVEFSLFGYETTVVEAVEILEEEITVADATITTIPTYTVSGTIVGNDALDLEGAVITLEGYDDYTTTTDATGAYSIADVFAGTYQVTVTAVGYDTYTNAALLVEADVVLDVTMTETIVTPYAVVVDVDGQDEGNALLTWNSGASSFADSFEDGTFDAWEQFIQGPGTPGEGGNPYWFATDDPDGGVVPDGSFIARADWGYDIDTWLISPLVMVEPGTGVTLDWFSSYHWSVDPNPNAELMVKISTDGGSTWEEVWNWQNIGVWENFTWYNTTVELTDYVGQAVHVAINLVGDDNAVTEIDNVIVGQPGKSGTFAISNPFEVAHDAKTLPAGLKAEKAFVGYNVFLDDVEIATEIAETSYLFEDLDEGDFTAGVQSVYSTGTSAVVTTDFSIVFGVPVTFTVTTNSGDSPEGSLVTLSNQDHDQYVYTHTVAADGEAHFPSVRKGMYTLHISHDNFHEYVMEDIAIMDTFTHTAELTEIIEAPFNLMVETEGMEPDEAHFSWNNALATEFSEGFEGELFPPVGWTTLNPDGGTGWISLDEGTSPVPGWQGGTADAAPDGGSKMAFATWNTGGETSNDQWLVTPALIANDNFHLEFQLKRWPVDFTENVDIRISTTVQNDPEAFDIIIEELTFTNADSDTWELYSYDLSTLIEQGTTFYIGFREHVANNENDGAAVMLDNVYYGPESEKYLFSDYTPLESNRLVMERDYNHSAASKPKSEKAFIGYNVFLNDVQVATDVTETNHMFTDLPGGTHTAGVQSVYTSGTSAIEEKVFTVEGIFVPENFPVTFTVTDDTEDYEALRIKGSMTDPEWMDIDLVADDNHVWSVTIDDVAPGSYEWGVTEDDGTEFGVWLLPPGPNLSFTLADDGTITGDVSYTLLVDDTSVDNLFADNISMFPNPASNTITLSSGIDMKEVKLIDISGRVVYASISLSNEHTISVRSLESGIYFVQILTSEGILTGKLQVQK